mgnify:CR=1 FL=1
MPVVEQMDDATTGQRREALDHVLLYGPPGNGKSSISHGIRAALGDKVYVPPAIE